MGSISKSYGYDVGRGGDPAKPQRVVYKGERTERRGQKAPRGIVERFVDLQGNVVSEQLVGPGVPATPDAVARARTILHAKKNSHGTAHGFIEHGKCPLRHGANLRNKATEEEFAQIFAANPELARPCPSDPTPPRRVRDGAGNIELHCDDGCPHIEALIKLRRENHARLSKRQHAESALDIERKKLAQMEETNKKLLELAAAQAKPTMRKAAE